MKGFHRIGILLANPPAVILPLISHQRLAKGFNCVFDTMVGFDKFDSLEPILRHSLELRIGAPKYKKDHLREIPARSHWSKGMCQTFL